MSKLAQCVWRCASISFFIFFEFGGAKGEGNSSESECPSGHLLWYMQCFNETPCDTYKNLRQTCDPNYTLPPDNFVDHWSEDLCTDAGVSEQCCCNSAAFQLHMLCLNCQIPREKLSDQPEEPQNATWTEYRAYFEQCPNGSTEGTPPTSPAGNAKQVIASMPFLMDHLPFESGWSYFATKEAAGDCSADANNISSPTPSSTLTNPVSLPTHATSIVTVESLTSTATSTGSILGDNKAAHRADVQSVPPGAIAGIVVAAVVVIGLLSVGLWYMRRQRRKAQDVVVGREIAQMTGNSATVPTRKRGAYLSMSFTPLLMRRRASSSSGSDTPPPITFHPDAMVRRASPMPFSKVAHSESLPGYAA